MPAITAETASLAQLPPERHDQRDRPVRTITTAPSGFEGEGFPVRRGFAGVSLADLDPFVHFDQMGEVEYAPMEPKGTPWHPHRGFETVTYMIDGEMVHQDSHGGGGLIADSATQWMTAGSGILHIETPPEALVRAGGLFHGVQLWVNLPAKDKMTPPAYQAIEGDELTLLSSADGGALVRVIAGEVSLGDRAVSGPGSTRSPITMLHATLQPGAQLVLPWNPTHNALAYVRAASMPAVILPGVKTSRVSGRPAIGVRSVASQPAMFNRSSFKSRRTTAMLRTLVPSIVSEISGEPASASISSIGALFNQSSCKGAPCSGPTSRTCVFMSRTSLSGMPRSGPRSATGVSLSEIAESFRPRSGFRSVSGFSSA